MDGLVAVPTYLSRVPPDVDLGAVALGGRLLGLPLTETGFLIARVLESRDKHGGALYPECVIQAPRRSTKTTAVFATMVARAATRPGFRCVFTAQTGTVASRVVLDYGQGMVARGAAVEAYERGHARDDRLPVLRQQGGRESITFPNGSFIQMVPPKASAVRSMAADVVVIDEGGEHDVAKSMDLYAGISPLMDTRGPLAQMIVMGTPGKVRAGLFWTLLAKARANPDTTGIVDYSMRDDDDPTDRDVWRRVHPGPSSVLASGRVLTPMSVLERRFTALGVAAFTREYLGGWPADESVAAIDQGAWAAAAADFEARPDRFAIAFDVSPDSSSAAIVAAWRDDDGTACIEVIDHRPGSGWVAKEAWRVARKYRVPVAHDVIGANADPAEALARARPTVKIHPLRLKDLQGAAARLVSDLRAGRLRHFGQPDLDVAVAAATWRDVGDSGRLFGRRASSGDVTALVAATEALWVYDQVPARQSLTVVTRRTSA